MTKRSHYQERVLGFAPSNQSNAFWSLMLLNYTKPSRSLQPDVSRAPTSKLLHQPKSHWPGRQTFWGMWVISVDSAINADKELLVWVEKKDLRLYSKCVCHNYHKHEATVWLPDGSTVKMKVTGARSVH